MDSGFAQKQTRYPSLFPNTYQENAVAFETSGRVFFLGIYSN
jgi:hypothetical protein